MPSHDQNPRARPQLGLASAVSLIVGIVIGAGIFQTPPLVAAFAGSARASYVAWALGGLGSLVGALCYAELATAFPSRGGEYHFLRRAFGERVAFLFGWSRFTVITTGSIAALAFVFGEYLNETVSLGPHGPLLAAVGIVVVLAAVNLRGIRAGAVAQITFATVKVAGLLLVVAAGVAAPPVTAAPASAAASITASAGGGTFDASSFGLAMVFVLLTYGGWNDAAYVSAELRGGQKTMVRALAWGLGLVTALYLLVVTAFSTGLGFSALAASKTAASDLVRAAYGPAAGRLVSLLVALSTLSAINGTMIAGARSTHAFAGDWPLLRSLTRWDETRGVPVTALRVQSVAALVLVGLGSLPAVGGGFRSMVEFTAPVFWGFFFLCGVSLLVLRRRQPDIARPFRVPLYPLVPLLFCAICLFMLWSSLSFVYDHALGGINAAWVGVAVLAMGAIVQALARRVPSS